MNPSGTGIVKSVLSGDSVILRGKPLNGPPAEKPFSLAFITSPRMGSSKNEQEQPFAFAAREFLRKLIVGKQVSYSTEYTTSTNSRDFGTLTLSTPFQNETNVAKIIVKQGWARVKPSDSKSNPSAVHLELLELEKQAASLGKGIWSDSNASAGYRNVSYTLQQDSKSFLSSNKGKPIDAILEQSRDAGTFRTCLIQSTQEGPVYQYITLVISGIKVPIIRQGIPNVPDLIEPFAQEAQFFIESKLLQKDITVLLEGVPPNANSAGPYPTFYATICHTNGNIAELLLSEGFAKVNDWTLAMVSSPEKYRFAENKAKDRKVRLWKDYVSTSQSLSTSENEFEGTVTRILGSDMLMLEYKGVERKLALSSVRGVKRLKAESGLETGYYTEAFEFLRSRLIGKSVTVKIDYVKPAEGDYEARECATILNKNQNVAEALISRGLAQVIKHRKDDENRSSKYDALLVAESRAQESKKGIWSDKEPTVTRVNDASESLSKARQFLSYLQKSGQLQGIVEYVSSASRFRIYIPSQSCRITFVLGGIRAPRAQSNEPFGPESLAFVQRLLFQRDVTVSVDSTDKTGGFIGSLFIEGKNVAVELLLQGFASVHEYSALHNPFTNLLHEAEQKALKERLGIWKDYDPEAEQAKQDLASLENVASNEPKEVVVSEILSNANFYIQILGDGIQRLEKMMAEFAIAYKEPAKYVYSPKVGDYVSAQFSQDKQWYRAQVIQLRPNKTVQVVYIDYGNSESVSCSCICALDKRFSLDYLPAQAIECRLAYIVLSDESQGYHQEALNQVQDFVQGKKLSCRFISMGRPNQVLLYDKNSNKSLNQSLIEGGTAYVDKATRKRYTLEHASKLKSGELAKELSTGVKSDLTCILESLETAKKAHLNIWRYGDFEDDDE